MSSDINKEQLDAMNIWQLRDLARKLGHDSPTSQRKQQLIDFVLEKYSGEQSSPPELNADEQPKKRGRGRPPKKVVINYDEILPKPEKLVAADSGAEAAVAYQPEPAPAAPAIPYDYQERKPDFPKKDAWKARVNEGKQSPQQQNQPQPYGQQNNQFSQQQTNFQQPPAALSDEVGIREGVLEICPDGYGFLRAKNYEQGEGDAYIAMPKIRKSGLRRGDYVVANVKKLAENRPWNVQEIISVNGMPPERAFNRPNFDSLTPIYPDSRLKLEIDGEKNDFAIRAIDLVAPIGKGQRAMIVSPPKAGKTTLLKKIAHSITTNYPDVHLIVLLVDERPEEVTDMQRSIKGEVIYSTFDEMPEHHTKAAEMVLERAKRLVECGKDVVILLDSLTRLARAYNMTITPTGKTLSGGIDPGALYQPKRFFGAARNIEFGGSLTIIATALIDTGSRMDDVIYEEFKGTGNMEIHLDRRLSEKRIFPAIDLNRSGTRKEELLLSQKELEGIWAVRKMLSAGDVQEATENLIGMLVKTANNKEFIEQLSLQIMKLQKEGYKVM
jgi:transcription termination factor Rho